MSSSFKASYQFVPKLRMNLLCLPDDFSRIVSLLRVGSRKDASLYMMNFGSTTLILCADFSRTERKGGSFLPVSPLTLLYLDQVFVLDFLDSTSIASLCCQCSSLALSLLAVSTLSVLCVHQPNIIRLFPHLFHNLSLTLLVVYTYKNQSH